ncbi:MAG: hypothetical protein D6806_15680 [Deltaproteobacteria bacterium]|nr:MAG: hypothetical protein D6806_15680 [Deltaproteobacteria bacterium]
MWVTVNLPEELLHEVHRLTWARNRSQALVVALEEFVRRRRLQRVLDAEGKLDFELSALQLRKMESKRLVVAEDEN